MIDWTDEEKRAVKSLKRLAKKWPKSLNVVIDAGSMTIVKPTEAIPMYAPTGRIVGGVVEEGFNYDLQEESVGILFPNIHDGQW